MPPATTEPRRKAPMVALRMGVMVLCFLLGGSTFELNDVQNALRR
jgi:hypothetical protein